MKMEKREHQYPLLLKPGKMGPWDLPNRIVMAPMGSLNATKDGYVTDRTLEFYIDKAKGGMGLIIVECTYMDDELSKGEDNCMGLYEHGQITGMAHLASVIHDHGVTCVLQLCHIGHQLGLADRLESLGPSTMVELMGGVMPFPIRGMTREEIVKLKEDFAMAAWRAKMAGFDGIQIHGAIGHLINMFCTPFYNQRTDEYGGSPENRIRLMIEIIEAVQEKCGKDYPIIARICGDDFDDDGITLEEGIIHAKLLEQTGIVSLHVVGGSNRNVRTINIQYDKRGDFVAIGEAFKKAGIKVPLIIDGGLSTPDIAEQVLADGKADFIGLGRPMLADPNWANKVKEDRPEDIVPCIRCCMGCVNTLEKFNAAAGLRCSVNPRCNLTGIREEAPLVRKKKVAVIGGGPGGMEAALLASRRGHEVTLYEKRKLGGMMHEACFDMAIKGDIQLLINYYEAQIAKHDIAVIHEEATTEKILDAGFEAVVVATGAVPISSHVTGKDSPKVRALVDYAGDRELELGDTVLVVGGCFPNVEMAYGLAKKGKKVILSTRRGGNMGILEVGNDNSSPSQQRLMLLAMGLGVEFRLGLNIVEITDVGAILEDVDTNERTTIACDDIILCRGYRGRPAIYKELRDKVDDLYLVGDATIKSRCLEPRTMGDAIHEGWTTANRI
jgi:2,4-dienoyl-CoA reductase-like NADH-dependent reductase (Old Yellow Enzyme family)/thioredoxin reductase